LYYIIIATSSFSVGCIYHHVGMSLLIHDAFGLTLLSHRQTLVFSWVPRFGDTTEIKHGHDMTWYGKKGGFHDKFGAGNHRPRPLRFPDLPSKMSCHGLLSTDPPCSGQGGWTYRNKWASKPPKKKRQKLVMLLCRYLTCYLLTSFNLQMQEFDKSWVCKLGTLIIGSGMALNNLPGLSIKSVG